MMKALNIACMWLLLLSACSDREWSDAVQSRTVVFSLSMDEGVGTRATMMKNGLRDYRSHWDLDDRFTLFFKDGDCYYQSEAAIVDVDYTDGKASFSAVLPEEMEHTAVYHVYGVSGLPATLKDGRPYVCANLIRTVGLNFRLPVCFEADVVGKWPEHIVCSHLGAYEILHFRNRTGTAVTARLEGYATGQPWYHEQANYNLQTGKIWKGTVSYGMGSNSHAQPQFTVEAGQTVEYWSWYLPTGKRMDNAVLKMQLDGEACQSANSRNSQTVVKRGNAYHQYAVWNGEKLEQGLESFCEVLRLGTRDLSLAMDKSVYVDILSGNGDYRVYSKSPEVASARLVGQRVEVTAVYPGEGVVTVEDLLSQTKQDISIKVTASDNLLGRIMQDMVYVEPGTFVMGQPDGTEDDGTHRVVLTEPFYIGRYEVTQALYEEVMGFLDIPRVQWAKPDWPMLSVTYYDAVAFVKKLGRLTGRNFRLATDAEWEYAARGGKYSRGYIYSGSSEKSRVSSAWNEPVGQKLPNELGIYGMTGGVLEWVDDDYHYTDRNDVVNPWHYSDSNVGTIRHGLPAVWERVPYERNASRSDVGLRIVLSLD